MTEILLLAMVVAVVLVTVAKRVARWWVRESANLDEQIAQVLGDAAGRTWPL